MYFFAIPLLGTPIKKFRFRDMASVLVSGDLKTRIVSNSIAVPVERLRDWKIVAVRA